ncbi:TPA: GNAT family N-acetyltransferase, partial [Vibrio vulnificus]|nr:GNAT family N-acetyltransferase [Vibrio vulnificus]
RGQKIGKALVEKSVDALTSIGVSKTHLFVYSNNVNAQNFYEKLGWFPRDEIRMYSFNNSSNPNV